MIVLWLNGWFVHGDHVPFRKSLRAQPFRRSLRALPFRKSLRALSYCRSLYALPFCRCCQGLPFWLSYFTFCRSFKPYHTVEVCMYILPFHFLVCDIYMCVKVVVMPFNFAFTHWVCMTHHSFYSFFQTLIESVLHPSLLLRPCYVSVDAMSHFDKVSWYHDGDIIV